jgi:hypothetical protein
MNLVPNQAAAPIAAKGPPVWLSVSVWLAVFVSPTACVLMVVIMDRLQFPAPPEGFVVSLFCLIPVVAVLACGAVVWLSKMSLAWRVGGLALTVLGMLFQCAVWLVIIVSAVSVAIAPVQ